MMNTVKEMPYKRVTFSLPKPTIALLKKIATKSKRSQSNTLDWLISAYDEIEYCYYCYEREKCKKFGDLEKKLRGSKKS